MLIPSIDIMGGRAVQLVGGAGAPLDCGDPLEIAERFSRVGPLAVVDLDAALQALALFDVDVRGLDRLDRAVLDALCRRFGGGPVGVSNLAVAVGEEADTVETVAEPFLVREGLIVRTSRGRAATALAWDHLGLTPPSQAAAYQASLLAPEDVGRLGS